VIDDHYYVRATKFYEDAAHYDKTDRNGPKIFVGEWATREGAPTPNFGAALGDAAGGAAFDGRQSQHGGAGALHRAGAR